jgi:hypothetical protein
VASSIPIRLLKVEINMTKFAKAVGAWITALALASCGGGGGSGNDGGFTAPGLRVSVVPAQTQTTPFSLVDVPVRVTTANGASVTDGTRVTMQVSSSSVGSVSSLQAVTGSAIYGERVTATTSGGTALFRFHSRAVGSMTLTATAADTAAGSAQVSSSAGVSVVAGAPNDPRLTFAVQATTLPINRFIGGYSPFLGSPYMSEVTVTWRRLNGELQTVLPSGADRLVVGVSLNPVNSVGAFSMLDDPETEDDPSIPGIDHNEFLTMMGQAPVDVNSGKATIFFHSYDEAGSTVMTVTAQDPDTNETLQTQITFNVVSGAPPLPASILLQRDGRAVYASNSGGNTVDQFEAFVYDASSVKVPDPGTPAAPVNNLEVEIVGGAQGGERIRTVNAQGATVSGSSVKTKTAQGIARFAYESGTRLGSIQVKATADRADNNVDNGIADPVSAISSITVGDGRLHDLDITSPFVNDGVDILFSDDVGVEETGNYYFNVSVLATDRFGNPVIPGTEIRFGSIDGPQSNGDFAIHGADGDPQEGGTAFNAPTGAFKTAGGGAGPNDTLIVFGEELNGNRDLESARRIATVPSNTALTVAQRFNYNDDTGATVNNGPVLPYLIGRAEDVNVTASAYTDQFGVAFARMVYPASKLGKRAVLYAQGNGDVVSGSPELVTDAEVMRLQGMSGGQIIASPDPIAGNSTVDVQVCLVDARRQGVANARLTFSFTSALGQASVDGVSNQGQLANATGPDGCATARVVTSGLPPDGGELKFSYRNGDEEIEDTITLRVDNNWHLYAFPSRTFGDGARLFTFRLVDSSNVRVPGVLIVGECQASSPQFLNISTHPGLTNAQGETTAIVDGDGFDIPGGAGSGGGGDAGCTFRTVNNEVEVEITWGIRDICDLFSPTPAAGCDSANLTVQISTAGLVTSTNPSAALQCPGPGSCLAAFYPLDTVTLSASANATWGNACAVCGTGTPTCTVALGAAGSNTTCTVSMP